MPDPIVLPDWLISRLTPVLLGSFILLLALTLRHAGVRRRRRLGRTVLLFGLALAARAIEASLRWTGHQWTGLELGHQLLDTLAAANLVAIAVFDWLLPAVGIRITEIVGDLSIGLAYVLAFGFFVHGAGVDVAGLVATSAVVSLVLGLAFQATLGTFAIPRRS